MAAEEPILALPTRKLLAAALGACIVASAGWSLIAWQLGFTSDALVTGVSAAAIVAAAMVAGILVIAPWRRRPVGLWISFWMAATVLRFLLTGLGTLLLYSAAPLGDYQFVAAVVGTYVLALLAEVFVLVRHLRHSLPV